MQKFLKTSAITYVGVLIILMFLELRPQENTPKKALDAFINPTTKSSTLIPVAGAEVILEVSPQKRGSVITGKNGNFGINFSNVLEEQGKDKPNITLSITITPPKDFPYDVVQNKFKLSLEKSKGPYYEFTLLFEPNKTNPNDGKLIIKPNTTYTIMAPDTSKRGAKQGKGSAVKTGDSYQGQVMHF